MECPRCRHAMQEILYEGVKIDTCPNCEGEWLDRDELKQIVKRREEVFTPDQIAQVQASIEGSEPAPAADDSPALACPRCGAEMRRFRYAGTTQVLIDRCPACGGIWFDKDELEQVQILVESWEKRIEQDKEKFKAVLQQIRRQHEAEPRVSVSRFRLVNALMTGLLRVFD